MSGIPTTETILAEHAAVIRARGKRVIGDIIEIGRRLTEAKKIAGHGNWLPWLEREFGWSVSTADRFVQVYENVGTKFVNMTNLDLPVSGLYLLAAPSTPENVRAEITERVATGEKITVADVRESKDRAHIVEHGVPELLAAVDRGEVLVSSAVAFVRKYPPTQQDTWIMRGGGSVVDAVTLANVAAMKARTAGQTVAATPGLFADVKAPAPVTIGAGTAAPDPKPAADRAEATANLSSARSAYVAALAAANLSPHLRRKEIHRITVEIRSLPRPRIDVQPEPAAVSAGASGREAS
jgi:Protein of unknown function (DUF3102)